MGRKDLQAHPVPPLPHLPPSQAASSPIQLPHFQGWGISSRTVLGVSQGSRQVKRCQISPNVFIPTLKKAQPVSWCTFCFFSAWLRMKISSPHHKNVIWLQHWLVFTLVGKSQALSNPPVLPPTFLMSGGEKIYSLLKWVNINI